MAKFLLYGQDGLDGFVAARLAMTQKRIAMTQEARWPAGLGTAAGGK